jgi:hypothetical protein
MKTGWDILDITENEFGSAKHENGTPSVQPKTSLGAQNMKTGPDSLGTAENMSGSEKLENGTGRPRYGRKRVWEHKT